MPGNVLRRNAASSSRQSFVIAPGFIGSQFALRMRIQIRSIAVEREHDEEFRIHPRGRNLGGSQPLNRRIQSLTKLHASISPRRPETRTKTNEGRNKTN